MPFIALTGGQGAAMAFEDCVTLSNLLSQNVKNYDKISGVQLFPALSQWQTHRQQRIRKVAAFTAHLADIGPRLKSTFQQIIRDFLLQNLLFVMGFIDRMKWVFFV